MDDDSLQKVTQRLAELPEDVRAAIQSADFAKSIQAIGAKHQLHIDQMSSIEDEVYLVMLGFEDPSNLSSNLAKALNVPREQADSITNDINEGIFLPIRASMQAFVEKKAQEQASPAPAAPAATEQTASMQAADMMLSQKTVSIPAQKTAPAMTPAAVAPKIGDSYKTDPYREPVE